MNQPQVVFTEGYPILNVKNVVESLDYYCNTLGFQDVFHWSREDTPPWTFAQVYRGNFFVYLCQQAQGGPGMWQGDSTPAVEHSHMLVAISLEGEFLRS